jgi:tRNA 5-methylaminomethyl-2-thiouridine biosynthesis bifunctional protein
VCLRHDQDSNVRQLAGLLPNLEGHWPESVTGARPLGTNAMELRNWAGVRCTTHDRLPVVGPLEGAPGVHVLTALGSRGITLGLLCADVLASHICGEPLPIDPAVAHLLRPHRFKKFNKPLI